MPEPTDKCAHPACHCPADWDGEYCSEACRAAPHAPALACRRGHAECQAEANARAA